MSQPDGDGAGQAEARGAAGFLLKIDPPPPAFEPRHGAGPEVLRAAAGIGSFKLRLAARLQVVPREPAAVVDVVLAADLAAGRRFDPGLDLFAHDFDGCAIADRLEPRTLLTHRLRVPNGWIRRVGAAAFLEPVPIGTAEAAIQGPDAMSLVQCGLHGQAYIAQGAIAEYLDGTHYLKITCTSGERLDAAPGPPLRSTAQAAD